MFRIFITADVAKEAKEILEKEFIVDIQPNMKEEELCRVIGDYDAIITRSQTKVTKAVIDAAIDQAIKEAAENGIKGKQTTPFLLAKVVELTGGDSLDSNIALVLNNARLAAKTAAEFVK